MVSKSDIVLIAKTINEYFVRNGTYPKSVMIKGMEYTIQEATYLMGSFIVKQANDIPKMKVRGASSPTGDRVNRKVVKSVYTDMCKRLVQYIKQNGRLPNYVVIRDGQRCSIILFMLQLSKIVSAYNNSFPASILINSADLSSNNSKSPSKKYGHATITGCDNRGQNNSVYCGPHSLQECIRNLTGEVIPQATLAAWAGTSSGGSSHAGLETAVAMASKKLHVTLTVTWCHFSELGWEGINNILKSKNQDCIIHNLYRNQYGHYEVVNSISESNIKVQNSLGAKCNKGCYCGYVEDRTPSTFKSYINGISQKSVMIITRK